MHNKTIGYSKPLHDLFIFLQGMNGHISESSIRTQNRILRRFDKIEKADIKDGQLNFLARKKYSDGSKTTTTIKANIPQLHQEEREHVFKVLLFFLQKINDECSAGHDNILLGKKFSFTLQELIRMGIYSNGNNRNEAREKLEKVLFILCSIVIQTNTETFDGKTQKKKQSGGTDALFSETHVDDVYTIHLCKSVSDWSILFGLYVTFPQSAFKASAEQLLLYLNAYQACRTRRIKTISYEQDKLISLCFKDEQRKKNKERCIRSIAKSVFTLPDIIQGVHTDYDVITGKYSFTFDDEILLPAKEKTRRKKHR